MFWFMWCARLKMTRFRIAEGRSIPNAIRRNLDFELMLADIASIEKRMERLEKDLKRSGRLPRLTKEMDYLERAKAWLESEKPLREMEMDNEEKESS